jgi:indole-3-glycerol phosphate synthase
MTKRKNWLDRIASVKAKNYIPVIAEIKSSSPSAGDLIGDRNITDITSAYVAGGAACISVVTGSWFGGNLSMLSQVAQATSLPLLRKDLIINLDQIRESQDYGANAVLLTKKILRESHLVKMINLCHTLNMTPFVEVSNLAEINEVITNEETIIGITNRDIALKETDIDSGLKSLELINRFKQKPAAIISASGINSAVEANILYQAGFDGLLIGTTLLKSKNPEYSVRKFSTRNIAQQTA